MSRVGLGAPLRKRWNYRVCRRADGSGAEVLGELGEDGGGGAGAGAADPFDVGVGSFPFWPVEHGGDAGRGQEG